MKALLQRVTSASVSVTGEIAGRIGQGLVALIGVASSDTIKDAQYLVQKATNLRIFTDEAGRFNLSTLDINGELLIVSQFTLMADTKRGRRPSFTTAAPPELAEKLYRVFVDTVAGQGIEVATGRFREHMEVELVNDGPVTLLVESGEWRVDRE